MSIADELALLANTKESLRVAIGLSTSIPFSQYAVNMPWGSDVIPATGIVFDFKKNRYAKDGKAVYLTDISNFIRLSSATMWVDGQLVSVGVGVPRISGDGLLIEKSSTELIPNNSSLASINTEWTATQKTDAQIGSVFEFVSDGSNAVIRTNVPIYPAGNVAADNGYYYRSVLAKKNSVDSYLALGSASVEASLVVNLKNGAIEHKGARVVLHRVSLIGEYWSIETISTETTAVHRQFELRASDGRGTFSFLATPTSGHKTTVAFTSFRDTADFPQSIIKTASSPATRAKETLVVPFVAGQTVTADKDEGVTMTIVDNNAVFEGQGYIRSIEVN